MLLGLGFAWLLLGCGVGCFVFTAVLILLVVGWGMLKLTGCGDAVYSARFGGYVLVESDR